MDDHKVEGYCPMGCGRTLFLGSGGYVTCSWHKCPDPSAVSDLLHYHSTPDHIVHIGSDTFSIQRAWREVGRLRHEVDCLREECRAWMNGVADVVEPLGYDRDAACGPADLLPGLTELRAHDMEMARRLHECVEARAYLYERLALNKRVDRHVD